MSSLHLSWFSSAQSPRRSLRCSTYIFARLHDNYRKLVLNFRRNVLRTPKTWCTNQVLISIRLFEIAELVSERILLTDWLLDQKSPGWLFRRYDNRLGGPRVGGGKGGADDNSQ